MKELVFIPGWSGDAGLWQAQQEALSDIAKSTVCVVTKEETVSNMAKRVLEQAPQRFCLVGHSLGGWVAQMVAIMAPERVEKLVLLSTWDGENSGEVRTIIEGIYQQINTPTLWTTLEGLRHWNVSPSLQDKQALFDLFQKVQERFPINGYINQTKAMLNSPPITQQLHLIQCPTLIVQGQDDPCFSMEQQMTLLHGIKDAKFTLIPHCGHMLTIEQPEAVTALIRLWIAN